MSDSVSEVWILVWGKGIVFWVQKREPIYQLCGLGCYLNLSGSLFPL